MIRNLVRKNILNLKPYSSARNKFIDGILLDANENPYDVFGEEHAKNLNRYPDPNHTKLREKLAEYYNISKENLFAGSGSDEVIDLMVRIFCEPGKDNVIVPEPTYGMYKVACDIHDVDYQSVNLNPDFELDIDLILKRCDENSKLIFICSPNNPTGNLLDVNKITQIAENFKGIIVIDEAYVEFSESHKSIDDLKQYDNVVRMRTFSKAWGLAGLRIGYCFAHQEIIELLYTIKSPYNLNKYSQMKAIDALSNESIMLKNRAFILEERKKIISFLKEWKYTSEVFNSDANFILFRTSVADKLFNYLVNKGIIIRDRGNQVNLKNCLRISVGTSDENRILIEAMQEFK